MRILRFTLVVLLGGCAASAQTERAAMALNGRVWQVRAHAFVESEAVRRAASAATFVLLGEAHDNREHHRLQLAVLEAMVAAGRSPALVMEQFDREHAAALHAELARPGRTADSVMDAGRFNRDGWDAEAYRPLVALALEAGLALVAGNVSRSEARAIVRDPARFPLPPVDAAIENGLAGDIERNHCGDSVEPKLLAGMVSAQRARDVTMAREMERYAERGAVLIAGSGHVRADRGAPLYMRERPLVIAFVEIDPERPEPRDYLRGPFASAASYDYLWFTPRAQREDPCAGRQARRR